MATQPAQPIFSIPPPQRPVQPPDGALPAPLTAGSATARTDPAVQQELQQAAPNPGGGNPNTAFNLPRTQTAVVPQGAFGTPLVPGLETTAPQTIGSVPVNRQRATLPATALAKGLPTAADFRARLRSLFGNAIKPPDQINQPPAQPPAAPDPAPNVPPPVTAPPVTVTPPGQRPPTIPGQRPVPVPNFGPLPNLPNPNVNGGFLTLPFVPNLIPQPRLNQELGVRDNGLNNFIRLPAPPQVTPLPPFEL